MSARPLLVELFTEELPPRALRRLGDAFAAGIAGAPPLVRALVKLYEDNAATLTPDPVHSAFYDSHPPAGERVARLAALPPPAPPQAA